MKVRIKFFELLHIAEKQAILTKLTITSNWGILLKYPLKTFATIVFYLESFLAILKNNRTNVQTKLIREPSAFYN